MTGRYIENPRGLFVVQTAQALAGLLYDEYPDVAQMKRGIKLLMDLQEDNGEWFEEAIPGSFHGCRSFSYPNYKFAFTFTVLGLFATRYPEETLVSVS